MEKKEDRTRILWHGKTFDLISEDQVLPNGKPVTVEVIRHPGSSGVVPLLEEGKVVLIRQYRPAVGDYLWEIPAGTLRSGEDPLACAIRELREECGLEGDRFDKLGVIAMAAGYSNERIHLFMATGIRPGEQHLDEDELLTTHVFPFDDVMRMIERGEIHEAMTIIGLRMAYRKRKGEKHSP
jgi:ADP-ribose pyrophosphatase